MTMNYDEEVPAGFQDADLEQAEAERTGDRIAALREAGICTHGWIVGRPESGEIFYPEQEYLTRPEVLCKDCGAVFPNEEAWDQARAEAMYR